MKIPAVGDVMFLEDSTPVVIEEITLGKLLGNDQRTRIMVEFQGMPGEIFNYKQLADKQYGRNYSENLQSA